MGLPGKASRANPFMHFSRRYSEVSQKLCSIVPQRFRPIAVLIGMLVLMAGCERRNSNAHSVREELLASESKSFSPASQPDAAQDSSPSVQTSVRSGDPVAMVNGSPIDRGELMKILMESRGLTTMQQLVLCEVSRQEARRQGIVVKPSDIDREYELTLQADQFDGKDPDKLTPARREELIANWLRTRDVSKEELAVAMRRQAYLRPMAERRVTITESMLRQEYERVHGEKVEVRHLQIPAPRYYAQIKERLDRGESFESLVKKYSQNSTSRDNGGLLPPISVSDDSFPPVFVAAAFALQPGQVSNLLEAAGSYHLLKLERKIPADGVSFEAAKPHLERPYRARLVAREMESLAEQLFLSAKLRIYDPQLREQYQKELAAKAIVGPPLTGP